MCHSDERRLSGESFIADLMAQSVEHRTIAREIAGSKTPAGPTLKSL